MPACEDRRGTYKTTEYLAPPAPSSPMNCRWAEVITTCTIASRASLAGTARWIMESHRVPDRGAGGRGAGRAGPELVKVEFSKGGTGRRPATIHATATRRAARAGLCKRPRKRCEAPVRDPDPRRRSAPASSPAETCRHAPNVDGQVLRAADITANGSCGRSKKEGKEAPAKQFGSVGNPAKRRFSRSSKSARLVAPVRATRFSRRGAAELQSSQAASTFSLEIGPQRKLSH